MPPRQCSTARDSCSLGHLAQQLLDLGLERLDLGVDLGERSGRHVLVEVAGERDLVADLGLGRGRPRRRGRRAAPRPRM